VRRACWKFRDRLGRGTSLLNYTVLHPNPTNKLVRIHSAPFWCWDKPRATLDSFDSPRPGFGGSHHLPPYSILCSSPPHLHPNGFFSQDSQSGVPKLSRFGLSGLWTLIIFRPELGLGRGLNQSCSFLQELFNNVSQFTFTHRNRVDSRLLVVGSQNGPSFDHNLCYRCWNGSCEAILDIYTSRPFQRYKERLNVRCFDPYNCALSFRESRRIPDPIFGSVSGDLTTPSKWGCDIYILRQNWNLVQFFKMNLKKKKTGSIFKFCSHNWNQQFKKIMRHPRLVMTFITKIMLVICPYN